MADLRPESLQRITTPEAANAFISEQIAAIKSQVGDSKVLLALSGGVDSSVVAALLIKGLSGKDGLSTTGNGIEGIEALQVVGLTLGQTGCVDAVFLR